MTDPSSFDSFDLDSRAALSGSHTEYINSEKEQAKTFYKMKSQAYPVIQSGLHGDMRQAGINPLVAYFFYLPPESRKSLLAMQAWDKELMQDTSRSFEIRYFWNFVCPSVVTPSTRFNQWLARLDIFFIRGTERRSIALWINGFKQAATLQGLVKLPNLIIMAAKSNQHTPDLEQDLIDIEKQAFIFFSMESSEANDGLQEWVEILDMYLTENQKLVRRSAKSNDPFAAYRPRNKTTRRGP
jgi:hypothetical protein